jgi:hypothetical protein
VEVQEQSGGDHEEGRGGSDSWRRGGVALFSVVPCACRCRGTLLCDGVPSCVVRAAAAAAAAVGWRWTSVATWRCCCWWWVACAQRDGKVATRLLEHIPFHVLSDIVTGSDENGSDRTD